jgi:hypothetical protein
MPYVVFNAPIDRRNLRLDLHGVETFAFGGCCSSQSDRGRVGMKLQLLLAIFDRAVLCLSTAAHGAFMPRCSKRSELIGSFVSGALISCALMAFAANRPNVNTAAARQPAALATGAASILAVQSRPDLLRDEAAGGDDLSNRQLSHALLDRYDLTGNSDDLYEALVWVDRRWDVSGHAELAERVFARYCEHRVVRWHWYCAPGE